MTEHENMETGPKVIDGHSHIGGPPEWMNPDPFLRLLSDAGVGKAIVTRFLEDTLNSNKYVKKVLERHPERLIGCFWVDPSEAEIEKKLKTGIKEWNFKMVKIHDGLHKFSEGEAVRVAEGCKELEVPLFAHLEDFSILDSILESLDLLVILAHLGTGVYQLRPAKVSKAVERAKTHENLRLDTSGTTYPLARKAAEEVGPEKLIFGSDAPHEHPGVALSMIEYLDLTLQEREMVCHKNLENLLQK